MSVKKNFFFNLILNFSNIVFPVVTIPFLTRILGVESFGHFNFVITIGAYFTLLAGLGVPYYGVREIGKVQMDQKLYSKLFSEIFTINCIASICAFLLYIVCALMIPQLQDSLSLFLVAGLSVLFASLNFDWLYSGFEDFKFIALRSVLVKGLSLICLFLFVRGPDDLIVYVGIYTFTTLGNHLINVNGIKKYNIKLKFTLNGLHRHIRPLFLLMFSGIAIQIYLLIDTVIIGFMRSYTEVGLYTSAAKIIRLIMPIITSLGMVLLPRLSNLQEKNSDAAILLLQKLFEVVNFISIPISFYFFCIAESFIPFFFGKGYEGAIVPMQIMAGLIFIANFSYFFSFQILVVFAHERKFLASVCFGMIVSVILNFLLINLWGIVGAALASLCAEATVAGAAWYFARKVVSFEINYKFLRSVLACSLVFVLSYFIFSEVFGLTGFPFLVWYSLLSWGIYFLMQYFIFDSWIVKDVYLKFRESYEKVF